MNDQWYLIILRLLHICCAIFWAGAVFYLAWFVTPAVKATGPEGSKFMQQLSRTNNMPVVITIAATLTVLCGYLLLWKLSSGFQSSWMSSRHGIVLSTGGLLATIAYLEGLFVTRPAAFKMAKISTEIANGGGKPSPEQLQQIEACKKTITGATKRTAIFLALTVIAMALAKYL